MNKAVFLDRDGIINVEIGDYIKRFEDFTLIPQLGEALQLLVSKGFLLVVITNQGGLAKNLYTVEELNKMHQFLIQEMEKFGVSFEEIYYCPHHPDYNGKCLCRKPGAQMVEKAIARFNIDPNQSYFIGDKQRDIDAGNAVGVKGILVDSNPDILKVVSGIGYRVSG
jgi:D-glycero-D-manno-heptose 1,7-bisphosphate phosphatase